MIVTLCPLPSASNRRFSPPSSILGSDIACIPLFGRPGVGLSNCHRAASLETTTICSVSDTAGVFHGPSRCRHYHDLVYRREPDPLKRVEYRYQVSRKRLERLTGRLYKVQSPTML